MSTSRRAQRMAQHHMRHKADAELNLIPLIDILSTLVAFLLVYSTEVEVIQNSKGIEIPMSIAQVSPKESVVVMITKTDLFVQGERVGSVQEVRDSKDAIVGPLRDALKRPLLVGKEMTERDLAQREITIMADKSLPYEVLKKVMSTCTDADYGKVSLAVIQKEKPVAPGQFRPG
jgi:biopolymer transport protein TolR